MWRNVLGVGGSGTADFSASVAASETTLLLV